MVPTVNLFELAEKEDIEVHFEELTGRLQGVFKANKIRKVIILAKYLEYQERLMRCVFAEELGHHFTSVGESLPLEYYSYSTTLGVDKQEIRAVQWGGELLVPTQEYIELLAKGYRKDEIADYFFVTEVFLGWKDVLMQGC